MIAGDEFVRMCAVYNIRALWERRKSTSTAIDVARGIWAHDIHIEGVRYVECLTDTPPGENLGNDENGDLFTPRELLAKGQVCDDTVLYVLEDYLGIRQIVAATPSRDLSTLTTASVDTIDERRTTWWKTVPIKRSDTLLASSDPVTTAWRTPPTPSRIASLRFVDYTPLCHKDEEWDAWHLTSVVCNEAGVTGYSAFWRGNAMSMRAHYASETDLSYYRHYDQPRNKQGFGIWVYFPLGPGERLAEVFVRRGDWDNYMGLVFRTNRDRDMVIGRRLLSSEVGSEPGSGSSGRLHFRHICSLPANRPARIHYNVSPHGVRRLALEEADPAWRPPARLAQLSPSPALPLSMQFAFLAQLGGVNRVTPSYKQHKHLCGDFMMCGLLFEYADKSRPPTSFGEFRLNKIGKPVDLSTARALYFGYFSDGRVSAHLTQVSTSPRTNTRTLTWIRIPLRGCAELWFDDFVSHIHRCDPVAARRWQR
ncbi:hypothetical protein SPI_03803 [Niveomyces insectorum RCEF 264]|uniref:Uncharacterized protein n=1 Tax=Niveomyces insectorum RCEF 264 TaxID=1081102 RepID=A0A162ML90_9HYPO|nr:hypothetical protein SPI_03803 [Niveomyces insectorum RCEF 264]